jgi:hypothetical protein
MLNVRQYAWVSLIVLFSFIAFAGTIHFCYHFFFSLFSLCGFTSRSLCIYYPKNEFPYILFGLFSISAGVVEETYYYLPWTVLVIFLVFALIFDVLFTAESSFVFDPNYDNWRRRVDSKYGFRGEGGTVFFFLLFFLFSLSFSLTSFSNSLLYIYFIVMCCRY